MLQKTILLLSFILLLSSCKEETETKEYKFTNNKELLKSVYQNSIQHSVANFSTQTNILATEIANYNKNTTIKNLEKAKKQWKITAKAYASIFAFNIGAIKKQFFNLRLYNWPSANNAIENFIKNKEITAESIANAGSSTKALVGIEYLLFHENSEKVNELMQNIPKRLAYLNAIAKELQSTSKLHESTWNSYSEVLVNSTEKGLSDPFNILFNGLNNVVHFATETKVGKPAGLLKEKYPNYEILQAFFSSTSLELIEENIKSVENVFFNENFTNISNKIEFVTKKNTLNNKLKEQFSNVYKAIKAIKYPLKEAITKDNESVKKLHEELKKLSVLFTVDVRSSLSLIITVTDGDGD